MSLEVGLFLGCKRYGGEAQRKKTCLILDSHPYRYRSSMPDISGQDIHSHEGKPHLAIAEVRNWISPISRQKGLPGGPEIAASYEQFTQVDLPGICKRLKRSPDNLTFADFSEAIILWLKRA